MTGTTPADGAAESDLIEQLRKLCEPLGIHEKLVKGGEEGIDSDRTLRRWLVARKWDVNLALRDLGKHADWRAVIAPTGRIPEEGIAVELSHKKAFLQGCDKEGHAVSVTLVHLHFSTTLDGVKRFIAYCLDGIVKMSELNGQSKVIGILDLKEMGVRNADFNTLRAIFDLLQNHYVERLHKLYLYCAPTIFYALWKMVCPFIDPVTREKVQFIEKDAAQIEFTKIMDDNVLPIRLGGKAELIHIDDAWKVMLEKEKSGPAPAVTVAVEEPTPAVAVAAGNAVEVTA